MRALSLDRMPDARTESNPSVQYSRLYAGVLIHVQYIHMHVVQYNAFDVVLLFEFKSGGRANDNVLCSNNLSLKYTQLINCVRHHVHNDMLESDSECTDGNDAC